MSEFVVFYGEAINKQDQELGVEAPRRTPMKMALQKSAVIGIRESFGAEMEDDGSIIYLSSGESFWVEEDITTVSERLNIKMVTKADEGIASK